MKCLCVVSKRAYCRRTTAQKGFYVIKAGLMLSAGGAGSPLRIFPSSAAGSLVSLHRGRIIPRAPQMTEAVKGRSGVTVHGHILRFVVVLKYQKRLVTEWNRNAPDLDRREDREWEYGF